MKSLAKQICSLIEQESNADCRGCMINPRCYVIDKLLALIESEKRKAGEEMLEALKEMSKVSEKAGVTIEELVSLIKIQSDEAVNNDKEERKHESTCSN